MKLSRYGGDCYAYCMLAAGLIDLIIETEIKTVRHRCHHPDRCRCWRHRHDVGEWSRTRRRSHHCCGRQARASGGVGNSRRLVARRARHESVKRRPELHRGNGPALAGFRVWTPPESGGARQADFARKISIAGVDTTSSRPAATIRMGWRMVAEYEGSTNRFICRSAASAQATVGAPRPSSGSCLQEPQRCARSAPDPT